MIFTTAPEIVHEVAPLVITSGADRATFAVPVSSTLAAERLMSPVSSAVAPWEASRRPTFHRMPIQSVSQA